MARLIVFFYWICTLSSAFAQPSAVSFYEDLERQYASIIGAHIAGGVLPNSHSRSGRTTATSRERAFGRIGNYGSKGPDIRRNS